MDLHKGYWRNSVGKVSAVDVGVVSPGSGDGPNLRALFIHRRKRESRRQVVEDQGCACSTSLIVNDDEFRRCSDRSCKVILFDPKEFCFFSA